MATTARPAATGKQLLRVAEFDLEGNLDGGQAFRWWRDNDGYRGVIGRSVVRISPATEGLLVEALAGEPCDEEDVSHYLGLDADLDALRNRYAHDPALGPAMTGYMGLRLLRQDPWECLCAFVCSATSNIPRIKLNMGALAGALGERIGPGPHDFAFPGPEAVAGAGEQAIRDLGWGFRAKYLAEAAEAVVAGRLRLRDLSAVPYPEALAELTALNGVGEKIADCVLAFSLGHGLAFPVDRWVRRAMEEWYGMPPGIKASEVSRHAREWFGSDAAYVQQYLFHRQRLVARAVQRGE
ncbi:MAG: DNA-3-methyladenine glycosylase family protein [Chloroflexota bacterium]